MRAEILQIAGKFQTRARRSRLPAGSRAKKGKPQIVITDSESDITSNDENEVEVVSRKRRRPAKSVKPNLRQQQHRSASSSSSTLMDDMPMDLVSVILSFLPPFPDMFRLSRISTIWRAAAERQYRYARLVSFIQLAPHATSQIIIGFLSRLPSVDTLVLDYNPKITNDFIRSQLPILCPHLTSLSLAGCSKVTDLAVRAVASAFAPSLAALNLSECPSLARPFSNITLPCLRSVSIAESPRLDISILLLTCSTLEKVDLSGPRTIAATTLTALAQNPKLINLCLRACNVSGTLHSNCIDMILSACPCLVSLDLGGFGSHLTTFDITQGSTSLRTLNLNRATVRSISGVFPHLQEIFLAWTAIDSASLIGLVRDSPELQTMDISGTTVTPDALSDMRQLAGERALDIDVSSCRGIPIKDRRRTGANL